LNGRNCNREAKKITYKTTERIYGMQVAIAVEFTPESSIAPGHSERNTDENCDIKENMRDFYTVNCLHLGVNYVAHLNLLPSINREYEHKSKRKGLSSGFGNWDESCRRVHVQKRLRTLRASKASRIDACFVIDHCPKATGIYIPIPLFF
jgi:hypothetical protein